jgi:hypothetical protein
VSAFAAIAVTLSLAAGAAADDPEAPPPQAPVPAQTSVVGGPDQGASVAAAYAAAEALQGPLDGLWRLEDQTGRTLFILSLADPGGAPAPLAEHPDAPEVEGAWRDPGRTGSPDGSGLIESVRLGAGRVRIRMGPSAEAETLSLTAGADGRWKGELVGRGSRRPVTMTRF